MLTVQDVADQLRTFAPPILAEEWDNVGLLVGDPQRHVTRVMTCLTLTSESAAEAATEQADLVVTHHPLPFRPLKQITSDTPEGAILLKLIEARVAVFSPHTALDSAFAGINQQLAEGLNLEEIQPLICNVDAGEVPVGSGRFGRARPAYDLRDLATRTKSFLKLPYVRVGGDETAALERIAIACGSGGSFLPVAATRGCDALVTGEATFHTCLAAEAAGVAMVLTGHYASERFALEALANYLSQQFSELEVWASREERDPLRWL